jgi:hypothetical protein
MCIPHQRRRRHIKRRPPRDSQRRVNRVAQRRLTVGRFEEGVRVSYTLALALVHASLVARNVETPDPRYHANFRFSICYGKLRHFRLGSTPKPHP